MRPAVLLAWLVACSPCEQRAVSVGALGVCAEVADTEAARAQGLSGREALEADEGLLLDFPIADEICIVNEGVSFPIDAIYIAPDDTVIAIAPNLPAGDATPRCITNTQRVLEVNAGVSSTVAIGDGFTFDD